MDLTDFKKSLAAGTPPIEVSAELQALWHEAKGEWGLAHELVQGLDSEAAAWVHAYLHRKEGDDSNAAYWYRRASKPVASEPLEAEWESVVTALL
jgi:hypothetical protein